MSSELVVQNLYLAQLKRKRRCWAHSVKSNCILRLEFIESVLTVFILYIINDSFFLTFDKIVRTDAIRSSFCHSIRITEKAASA
jgi:hypothetical protein